ncbi:MAG: amidase [Chloroflexota bacterium]
MNDILLTGAAEIARRIKAGLLDPVDVIDAHIARIQAVNPRINALIIPMFDEARQQARNAADRIAQGNTDDLPPLYGVPITIKDCWPIQGVRSTGGSIYHADTIADRDAPVVKRLKEAGAIILGKTNLPDMCWSGDTVNPIFGRSRNPHAPKRTTGGSSGGEGAIIAAGGSPLGLGSDIAGSVRHPAAACGCVSLKPTGGRVPNDDHIPMPPPAIATWNNAGPMARRVEDLALALSILSDSPVRDFREIALGGRKVTVFINRYFFFMSDKVREAVAMAAGALGAAGMTIERNDRLPLLQSALYYLGNFEKVGANRAFEAALGGGKQINYAKEYWRNLRRDGRISPEVLTHALTFRTAGWLLSKIGFGRRDRLERNREKVIEQMGDVLLLPILLTPASRHSWTYWTPIAPPYSFLFNSMNLPAAVVPVSKTSSGLPIAVQIVGRPDDDEMVLAVAAELERVFGGWQIAE